MKGRRSTSRLGLVGGVGGEVEVENERGRWSESEGKGARDGRAGSSSNPLSSSSELISALGMFQLKWAVSTTANTTCSRANCLETSASPKNTP
ncbi:uncharacterized protein MONOS_10273 [Monocercomonoides exilis]|uniref:uncharacterized protein n=1 Tax=Monocercomonoides exilis TaxID=2049356 RepID=UPI003559F787|nr:hypothetical protein MONOS_10273 [Monocercomonoides exilis]|eukprot:MONOS_10273.1-p1 / transcript=MONOS_10273.1 / gene=MONOS_10273 / organism=Monocercomonoides_exilis_PA203 / gene_product=unspecified product / transcript_product=unspecified product / location=Mono_scaffold00459:46872-47150(-) / protein_length=93 / sequence_SO=supercontig / SO=protein_coding / is_pseudo=false